MRIRQVAYLVPDVRVAATRHRHEFGSGPFLVADHIPLASSLHRGRAAPLDHSAAYGKWGDVMVEFVQQNNDGPSAFRDMYPSGGEGLHHVAIFVDDLGASIAEYARRGDVLALHARMPSGFAFAMVDTVARYGHMIELYQPDQVLVDFYALVAGEPDAGRAWRTISLA